MGDFWDIRISMEWGKSRKGLGLDWENMDADGLEITKWMLRCICTPPEDLLSDSLQVSLKTQLSSYDNQSHRRNTEALVKSVDQGLDQRPRVCDNNM